VEGLVAPDRLHLRGRLRRCLQQQVEVVGHHLVGDDAYRVEGGHPVKDPDELLLVGLVERAVVPVADGAVVTVVPRIPGGGLESGMTHRVVPFSGRYWSRLY
jgi:hypothetical protein